MIRRYPDPRIARVMADLNIGKVQAIHHLQQRDALKARLREQRAEMSRGLGNAAGRTVTDLA